LAEVQLEQALADNDSVRKQLAEELEQIKTQLRKDLEDASAEWGAERTRLTVEWEAERARLTNEFQDLRVFEEAQQRLVDAGSQSEMLICFLNLSERFSPSTAVYIAKADGLELWKSRGDAAFPAIASSRTIDPELFYRQVAMRGKVVLAVCSAQPCN